MNPGESPAENPVPFWQPPTVDASMPPPLAPGVPERVPGFRADAAERTEAEPLSDYDTSADAPSFKPVRDDELIPDIADPVPVLIVGPTRGRDLVDWSTARFAVSHSPAMVAGANRNRRKLVLNNNDLVTPIAIMRGPTDNPASSYLVRPGEQLELTHNAQVWAALLADAEPEVTCYMSVVNEFIPEEPE